MGLGFEDVSENPAEKLHQLGTCGGQRDEILHVAPLVTIQGGAELEQDKAFPADEADFEIAAVFPGVEILPEPGGKARGIE